MSFFIEPQIIHSVCVLADRSKGVKGDMTSRECYCAPVSGRVKLQYSHGRMNYKDTKPYMSAFLSADLCGILFNRFYRLEIHSLMVCIFDPACGLLPPRKKELYFTCVLLPLYCTFSLTSFNLPPFPMYSIYRQCVTVGEGGRC